MNENKIIRVFPRQTNATPDDELVRFTVPGLFDQCDEVHVSVTFSYDRLKAERLAEKWKDIAPVKIGGPGYGTVGGEFEPGMYVKKGYTITSRGCPNKCWFCEVWKRDGNIRELPIKDGYNVLDDNLLSCSEDHIRKVFAMLKRQKHEIYFTGGLEAAILKDWHVDLLVDLKPKRFYLAYDTEDDYEPLASASKRLFDSGITPQSHTIHCFVLIGYPHDTFDKAESRLNSVLKLGIIPMAMLWKNKKGETTQEWNKFKLSWVGAKIVGFKMKQMNECLK